MKPFVINVLFLSGLLTAILTASLFGIPNIAAQHSLLGALPDKHKMLMEAGSPKIVFVGGSNLSFGLESKKIHERFKRPVVNTGLHAGIGLRYFATDVLPYIQDGDIVVLCPEYQHFYTDLFYGDMELVSVLFDIFQDGRKHLSFEQWYNLIDLVPRYAISKLKFQTRNENNATDVYSRKSFNTFGDAYLHWSRQRTKIEHAIPCTGKEVVNPKSIAFIREFSQSVKSKGASLCVLPPVYAATSFNNQRIMIKSIEQEMNAYGVAFITDPVRYKLADTLFFNTNYHLTKKGVDMRTKMVMDDLQKTGLFH
ncbi:hypothetical protein [Dyadobacter sp. CY323]|uniref:hypothetical protein n=1 Tax=Dyadobacter sp. CY323 TaxID=2907302 RepID=UPI001F1971A8|nr:hypothetical protein [Dyadobacter sp. CY323]MCE6990944.1 hypothetical protein [Dyadobacter sp. CY323]